jgi:ketosteroid isomerase-like protein
MKKLHKGLALSASLLTTLFASAQSHEQYTYKPKDLALYDTIVHMDSVYFTAYNTCDMATQADIYADDLEFYHDANGLSTNKQALLKALKENICGKVSRVLVKGSIEVYPLPGFGAVEMALHKFINHAEGDHMSPPERFIVIWRHKDGKWQITRVISLHGGS